MVGTPLRRKDQGRSSSTPILGTLRPVPIQSSRQVSPRKPTALPASKPPAKVPTPSQTPLPARAMESPTQRRLGRPPGRFNWLGLKPAVQKVCASVAGEQAARSVDRTTSALLRTSTGSAPNGPRGARAGKRASSRPPTTRNCAGAGGALARRVLSRAPGSPQLAPRPGRRHASWVL